MDASAQSVFKHLAERLSADDVRAVLAGLAKVKLSEEAEAFSFFDFNDLLAMRLVKSRAGLWALQRDWGFPRSTALGGKRSGFRVPAVKQWVEAQCAKPPPLPGARTPPNRPAQQPYPDQPPRKRGRPRKNPPLEEAAMQK